MEHYVFSSVHLIMVSPDCFNFLNAMQLLTGKPVCFLIEIITENDIATQAKLSNCY